jgi:hypothetical protein
MRVIPLPMVSKLSPGALDALHGYSQSLVLRLNGTPPLTILHETLTQINGVEKLLPVATGCQRSKLHRTAALTALVAARASRWADTRYTATLIDRAEEHAQNANDGPLRAQALVLRGRHVGEAAYAVDAGSPERKRLLMEALSVAGSPHLLRAIIRYELAWQYAAVGDSRAALMELGAADIEHDRASPDPDVVESADGGRKLPGGYRGATLRKLRLYEEAITTCTDDLTGPPQWQTSAMVNIARVHATRNDVDTAAATLEEAFLMIRQAGLTQRRGRVKAVRALLPDTVAVRQLDAVMFG